MSNTIFSKGNLGFTLVELLISIVILSILSGVTMGALNIGKQQDRAEDGVKRANLEKLYIGFEAYKSAEGAYPIDVARTTSFAPSDSAYNYIKNWPTEPAGAVYTYTGTAASFTVSVPLSTCSTQSFTYTSDLGKVAVIGPAC